jgi:hypothetical protein
MPLYTFIHNLLNVLLHCRNLKSQKKQTSSEWRLTLLSSLSDGSDRQSPTDQHLYIQKNRLQLQINRRADNKRCLYIRISQFTATAEHCTRIITISISCWALCFVPHFYTILLTFREMSAPVFKWPAYTDVTYSCYSFQFLWPGHSLNGTLPPKVQISVN